MEPKRRAVATAATTIRIPAEYSVRNKRPQRMPRTKVGTAARRPSPADSARHQAWNAASATTIMSAEPFTATTCCHTGTDTKSPTAASQPAGAPKSLRARSNASQIAAPKRTRLRARRR